MITLPDKFERDVQSNQTSLIPLVVIDPESDNPIYISTVKGIFDGNTFWEDRGLNVSSIKESINLIKRRFKINNISFNINNYPVNGVRFSDFVRGNGLINKNVKIYYKTQSCINLDDCIPIYEGRIKRFDHNSKTVKIQLEDLTEGKLSKKVPIANTGYRTSLYNESYKNTPIPMTYGSVDKAPSIPIIQETEDSSESKITIISDDVLTDRISIHSYFSDNETAIDTTFSIQGVNPLYIYKDDYFQVLENYDSEKGDTSWMDNTQYIIQENYIEVPKIYEFITAKNPPANNEFQCFKQRFPNDFIMLKNPAGDDEAYIDDSNQGIVYLPKPIANSKLAVDNPIMGSSVNSHFTTHSENFIETFATIPDPEVDIAEDWNYLVSDFRPTLNDGDEGVFNHVENLAGGNMLMEVMSWINRYAHINQTDLLSNPDAEAQVVFTRLPAASAIRNKINVRLWEIIKNSIPEVASGQVNLNFDWSVIEIFNELNWSSSALPSICNTNPLINSVANIQDDMTFDWAANNDMDTQ